MKFSGFYILIFALAFNSARAQDLAVRAVLDTNKALIGDQLILRLTVQQPATNLQVNFPVFHDTLARKIEIINISPVDTVNSAGNRILSQDVVITVFDTGFFEIPALPFRISAGSQLDTLNTLPISFEIHSVKADSTIRDIKAIYKVPVSIRELIPYILGLIGIWLVTWLVVRYFTNRKIKNMGRIMAVSSEPPDIIALRALDQLRDEKPWLNNKIKYYYIRISEILRIYIENRFKTPALEQTTDEILYSLKSTVMDNPDYNRLSALLKLADLVKFAKVIPDQEENALQIDAAKEFVQNTPVPKAAEVPENENEVEIVDNKLPS